MLLRCVIFDLGDTLVDNKNALKNVDRDVTLPFFEDRGFEGDLPAILKAKKTIERDIQHIEETHGDRFRVPILLGRILGVEITPEEAKDYVDRRKRHILQNLTLHESALEILKGIKAKGLDLVLLSDGWRDSVYSVLDKFKIKDYFSSIFVSEDLGKRKKSTKPFEILLRSLNYEPSELLMVGDSLESDGRARDVGIWFCLFDPENRNACEDADFKIRNLLEIDNIVEFLSRDVEFGCYICKKEKVKNWLFCENCIKNAMEHVLKFADKNGIRDLTIYKNEDENTILKRVVQGPLLVRNEWIANFPRTEDEIRNFYKKNFDYVYDLTLSHSLPSYAEESNFVVSEAYKHGGSVIDFGAGTGDLTIELAKRGLDTTHGDLGGVVMDYAKWRAKNKKLNIKFLNLDSGLEGIYDVVVCLDVIEHISDPVSTLKSFYKHLDENGILIINERFQDIGNLDKLHPMHLLQNHRFRTKFKDVVLSNGFSIEEEYRSPKKGRVVYVFSRCSKEKHFLHASQTSSMQRRQGIRGQA